MRMMVKIQIPTQDGSEALQDGSMERLISESLAAMNPECAYFYLEDGLRTMLAVFDMQATSDMVPLLEPAMMELNAEVQLLPVMTLEDLKSGFNKLQTRSTGARTSSETGAYTSG
jgi:hypothetical protein